MLLDAVQNTLQHEALLQGRLGPDFADERFLPERAAAQGPAHHGLAQVVCRGRRSRAAALGAKEEPGPPGCGPAAWRTGHLRERAATKPGACQGQARAGASLALGLCPEGWDMPEPSPAKGDAAHDRSSAASARGAEASSIIWDQRLAWIPALLPRAKVHGSG